jgi:hypothetical protein
MNACSKDRIRVKLIFQCFQKRGESMTKKGIQNSSIEQMRNDHETETAFKVDDPKKHGTGSKRTK